MKQVILSAIILFMVTHNSVAQLVINEAMVNEPESHSTLEWIELFNASSVDINLSDYALVVDSDTVFLPDRSIAADAYLILCRKLFSESTSPSFESFWGNNSLLWGDTEFEQMVDEPVELSFLLKNSGGRLHLLKNNIMVSTFIWDEIGIDGHSWERKELGSDDIRQSVAGKKSTPGRINSVSLLPRDISIDAIDQQMIGEKRLISVTVTNRGYETVNTASLRFIRTQEDIPLPELSSDTSYTIECSPSFQNGEIYFIDTLVILMVPEDDRPENDTLIYTAAGELYPPLIITEFLANPSGTFNSEWIEIYNRSGIAIELAGWLIGDSLTAHIITGQSVNVLPGQFVLLVESEELFLEQYQLETDNMILLEPTSWAKLNNTNDKVRLVDSLGITAGSYSYHQLYPDNFTVSRKNIYLNSAWGRSAVMFGSPGEMNSLFIPADDPAITISLSSQYIDSKNMNGNAEITISLSLPDASAYTVKIYDRNGRIVKTFYKSSPQIETEIMWDGSADTREQLPVGIYILYVEAVNINHAKEVIVIAR